MEHGCGTCRRKRVRRTFFIQGKGWTTADLLENGDISPTWAGLKKSDGVVEKEIVFSSSQDMISDSFRSLIVRESLAVIDIEVIEEETTVYNFEVEDDHTYFVTDAEVWVHNAPPGGYPWSTAEDVCKADTNGCRNTIIGLPENREAHAKGFKEGLKNVAESALDSFLAFGDAVACGMSGTKVSCENTKNNIDAAVDSAEAIYEGGPGNFFSGIFSGVVEKGKDIRGENGAEKAAQTFTELGTPMVTGAVAGKVISGLARAPLPDHPKAIAKGYKGVKMTPNGGPDFSESPYIYPAKGVERSVVEITLTGSRTKDYAAALLEAKMKSQPTGYVWHHVDDYNPKTGKSTMQLVEHNPHSKIGHKGSVRQYEIEHNMKYKK